MLKSCNLYVFLHDFIKEVRLISTRFREFFNFSCYKPFFIVSVKIIKSWQLFSLLLSMCAGQLAVCARQYSFNDNLWKFWHPFQRSLLLNIEKNYTTWNCHLVFKHWIKSSAFAVMNPFNFSGDHAIKSSKWCISTN